MTTPVQGIATAPSTPSAMAAATQLTESDFLTLLSTELKYQSPSNPVNNTQMIAELAQFSSLAAANQQEQTLTQIKSQLAGGSGSTALLTASQLIGKTVTTRSSGSGTVAGVTLGTSGAVQIDLANGISVAASELTGVH